MADLQMDVRMDPGSLGSRRNMRRLTKSISFFGAPSQDASEKPHYVRMIDSFCLERKKSTGLFKLLVFRPRS